MSAQGTAMARRIQSIQDRMATAALSAGRDPQTVRLIAVSKRHDVARIRMAYEAGQRDFGENYAQEFRAKATALADLEDLRWHFIGGVQSNKAKVLVQPGQPRPVVHTVDRPKLVDALQKTALGAGGTVEVLIEVNFGEAQKAGVREPELAALFAALGAAPNLRLRGLMCIPPPGEPEQTRTWFRRLAELGHKLSADHDRPLPELSMGMSADFEVAIEEGATWVRVGTAIFGERPS